MQSDHDLPPREATPGRGEGAGSWYEQYTLDAYDRWGRDVARGGIIWGQEIDVFSVDEHGRGRRITQCKDWRDRPVTPATLWRLIALAYTVRAQPVLATTTELTQRARQIARRWEVAVVTPYHLDRPHVPPIAGEYLGDPDERRWSSRLDDDGRMRELLLRGVHPRREREPSY